MKEMKISTRLILSSTIILILVAVLGIVAYFHSDQIWDRTVDIQEHPFQVAQATRDIKADILIIHRAMMNLALANSTEEINEQINIINTTENEFHKSYRILHSQYLGDQRDVDSLLHTFTGWKQIREETIHIKQNGEDQVAIQRTTLKAPGGLYINTLMNQVRKIMDFSNAKAKLLFAEAQSHYQTLKMRLLAFILILFLVSLLITYFLIRGIRRPLTALTMAAEKHKQGDFTARVNDHSNNETGMLAKTFNSMAEFVEEELTIKKHAATLSALMLQENGIEPFFQTLVAGLAKRTGAQNAAIYLFNPGTNDFEHVSSVGLLKDRIRSFSARHLEGEFGAALSEKTIQRISRIPDDTAFIFPAVTGTFMPKEVITIPILDRDEVIAVISLAGIQPFSATAIKFLNEIQVFLNARINGVLAFRKMSDYSEKLNLQNRELSEQSRELAAQSDEMKEYTLELEMQKNQLMEANQLKSSFLSNMSHELRTPLNSVIALSGVLSRRLKDQIPADESNYIGIIEKNGRHLLTLINDILDLSRIEAGKEELNFSRFTMQDLITDIIVPLGPIIVEKKLNLINHVGDDLPPLVSDSDKCRHLLQNVISNAVKFTEQGSIEISCTKRIMNW
jgi:signal transduction histidine kinase